MQRKDTIMLYNHNVLLGKVGPAPPRPSLLGWEVERQARGWFRRREERDGPACENEKSLEFWRTIQRKEVRRRENGERGQELPQQCLRLRCKEEWGAFQDLWR